MYNSTYTLCGDELEVKCTNTYWDDFNGKTSNYWVKDSFGAHTSGDAKNAFTQHIPSVEGIVNKQSPQ